MTAPTKAVHKIGLLGCIAIVCGNMMGSGIALLPSTLAKIGSIAAWGWVIVGGGALALAYVFAHLVVRFINSITN